MDSQRNQPLINNPYPTLENNNTNFGQQPVNNYVPQNQNEPLGYQGVNNNNYGHQPNNNYVPPQNQGWNPNQNQPNGGWNNNQPNQGWNANQPNNQGWNNNQPNQPINPYKNQGFMPNPNPGFNNNVPPNFPGQQPYLPGQQPYMPNQIGMPKLNQQKIIIIQQHSSLPCKMCGFDGQSTWRQAAGCATYGWCICLMLTAVCCWIPFCIDSCYDTEVICTRCGQIKAVIPARCC